MSDSAKFDPKAHAKQKYEARKAAGLCARNGCPNQRSAESVYCPVCLDKQRSRQKTAAVTKTEAKETKAADLRGERAKSGTCLDCGDERFSKLRCRACYALYLEKEKGLTRYDARKQVGLCQYCPAIATDGIRCDACRVKKAGLWRKRKAEGLCAACGDPNDRPGMSKCSACTKKQTDRYAERKDAGQCPHCGSDEPIAPGKHCKRCRKTNRKKDRRKARKLRQQVIEAYGGVCKCCTEDEPAFLCIDHVNDDGAKHRRELFGSNKCGSNRFYTWLRKNNFPQDGFQLLCANCNLAKARYGRCPHQAT